MVHVVNEKLIERIHLMSFDTTASNIEVNIDACVLHSKKSKETSV